MDGGDDGVLLGALSVVDLPLVASSLVQSTVASVKSISLTVTLVGALQSTERVVTVWVVQGE